MVSTSLINRALLTDMYEVTMAEGYFRLGKQDTEAVFNVYFRKHPFDGGFTIAAGLEAVVDFIEKYRFSADDIAYLATLPGDDGAPVLHADFLDWLAQLRLTLDIDAVPEGTVVFPHEPLLRVRGPLAQAQLIETALLNLVNFPTLVATKAAQVVRAADGAPVLEFGTRRAQGIDGALTASRSAYLGGCAATSSLLAGQLYDIPVRGTHAHSWILSFATEEEAFAQWAAAMPNNTTLLVDTYGTLNGVTHAVEVARQLRAHGRTLAAIRLDSGDLAFYSIQARAMFDAAGFPDVRIVASNDLDPETIASLREQGARIDTWGVGTKLVTAYDQPALGGVYKLVAIRDGAQGRWRLPIKVSDEPAKVSVPGVLGVRRYYDAAGLAEADMIYDLLDTPPLAAEIVDPTTDLRRKTLDVHATSRELLVPIFVQGRRVYTPPPLGAARAYAAQELASFHPSVLRRLNPHRYPAGLERGLHERRQALIATEMQREQRPGAG